jgi:putative flavoprotein involved in K+ transport
LQSTVLTVDSPLGRKINERGVGRRGSPLIRVTPEAIRRAGVERVPRTEGVVDGKPRLADGPVLDVAAVVWATGFRPDFSWIELPILGAGGYPVHYRGVAEGVPGLYFLGLPFQYTLYSSLIGGVGADARYVAEHIRNRATSGDGAKQPPDTDVVDSRA